MIVELQQQIDAMQAQYEAELKGLRATIQELLDRTRKEGPPEEDAATLRELARSAAAAAVDEEEIPDKVFRAGGLSLQALNPEISVTGDMLGTYSHTDANVDRWKFKFRNLGLHFESYLDPYTRFKAAVPVNEEEAKIGEAYMTRFGVLDNVNLTIGKFRQQFGVVNRWHKHGLDQVDFPLALRRIFGNGGLNQTGVSIDWTMPPLGESSQELTCQLTNGENSRLFGDNSWHTPCLLLHYKNFRDLSKDMYLEAGLSGLVGWNDSWSEFVWHPDGGRWCNTHKRLPTSVFGGDLALRWEPTERMRYRNLEWRSELYYLDRQIPHPVTGERETLTAWGGFTYVQSKLSRRWEIGLRADYYDPDYKDYADMATVALAPLAYAEHGAQCWQISPYATWFQSPFVRVRVEYDHLEGHRVDEPEDAITLQVIFAAGPHKHERY
ncbi:MAG TPA: hypothetical protein HPP77_11660 [Candidatus Hydrogenedentes bacterium]|nr:hypothetical protein [Candidatus Hydrogenedentota bacterium]HIJ72492.1 hypothetical protein [Candidatus Hydrogenedentota bacterium]